MRSRGKTDKFDDERIAEREQWAAKRKEENDLIEQDRAQEREREATAEQRAAMAIGELQNAEGVALGLEEAELAAETRGMSTRPIALFLSEECKESTTPPAAAAAAPTSATSTD